MKIKKELKENYKFFQVICYFFNNLYIDNLDHTIKKEEIILKIKNKKPQLIFHIGSGNIEIRTVFKSKIVNFEKLKKTGVVTNAGDFRLIKNVSPKIALTELLFFIIHCINDDFYIDEELNEIASHSYSMSLSQMQKHLHLHHGKNIDKIGNNISHRILDKTREIMSSMSEHLGSNSGFLPFNGYDPLNVKYNDSSIIEDQFISYKKIFCGADFLSCLSNNLNTLKYKSLFTLTSNIYYISIIDDLLRHVSLLIYSRLIGSYYKDLKKAAIYDLLDVEKNGKERIIHKILYIVNYIDSSIGKLNSFELYKLITIMCLNVLDGKEDRHSTKNIESVYSNRNHMKTLIAVIDAIDSIALDFFISNFKEESITVSVDNDICEVFPSMEKFEHLDTVDINNNFFIRLDPKYNDGIYAIFYNKDDDSAMIMIESNGSHRVTAVCSSFLASYYKDYTFYNNALFMLNINEGHYADVMPEEPLDFYRVYADILNAKMESFQTMLFSLNDESYFESNETFNIVCNNDIKNSQLYLTYDKDATYKINFWKTI